MESATRLPLAAAIGMTYGELNDSGHITSLALEHFAMTDPKSPEKRRRVPYWSLVVVGALVVLAAIVGIRFGTPFYDHYRTIVDLKAKGFEFTALDRNSSPWRKWLLNRTDANWKAVFCPALEVNVSGPKATDEDLRRLVTLENLWAIHLMECPITDAGLAHLSDLTNLRVLTIEGTRITDDGLGHLEGMSTLLKLVLIGTRTTDAGMEHVAKLTSLKTLELKRVPVTDAGLARLATLSNLQILYYAQTKITPAGIAKLQFSLPTCQFHSPELAQKKPRNSSP